jgi:DNA-binding CsgD family transcriptional regulator/tetratricopeptide (TPR) repeat protein
MATRGQRERTLSAVATALQAIERSPDVASRAARALPALVAVWTGQPAPACIPMLEGALAAPPYGERPALEWSAGVGWMMAGLAWCDAYERRDPFLDAAIERAQRRVALVDLAVAATWRAYGRLRQGRLRDAESDVALAAEIYEDLDQVRHGLVSAIQLDILIARGSVDAAERLLDQVNAHLYADELVYLFLVDARARMRIAQGRLAEARDDLELIDAEATHRHFRCPGAPAWRTGLAVVMHGLGETEGARKLAVEHLERCRAFGAPRALGLSLLGVGVVEREEQALAALREAVEVLAPSPARLEYAHALRALGSRVRRLGQRSEALGLLRDALAVATECSADALVVRIQDELTVLGARPRRGWVSGPAALTAAERRVATLAAAGASNGEIALELVVTLRTVETHLTSIYRKLDIRGRGQLAEALEHDHARA